ncbi:MAG: PilN domain-containing protein [Pseudomonadota bacterium]
MIKIQLAPYDELEDKNWWVPDAIALVLALFLSNFLVSSYVERLESEIVEIQAQTEEFKRSIAAIQPEIAVFKGIEAKISELKSVISALSSITVSRLTKYRPVVVLEQIQALKPDGLWFTSLKEDTIGRKITISGFAFDSILIGQFMSELGATKLQRFDPTDIRSQINFSQVKLKIFENSKSGSVLDEIQPNGFSKFDIYMNFEERTAESIADSTVSH